MGKNIIIGILTIAMIGAAYWGYQQQEQSQTMRYVAESRYQNSFHELTYYMDKIHDKIGTTLAMNSRKSVDPELADVWRLSAMAHSNVGELPNTMQSLNKTEEFLANIGEFSYKTAIKDQKDKPLTKEEYNRLEKLYSQSKQIEKSLYNVQQDIAKSDSTWVGAQLASAEEGTLPIADGLQSVDDKVARFKDDWQPENDRSTFDDGKALQNLGGKKISKKEAIKKAKDFLRFTDVTDVSVQKSGKGMNFKAYFIELTDANTNTKVDLTMTQNGGHLISFFKHRDVAGAHMSLYKAIQQGKAYLKDHEYENMQLVKSDQYNNYGVLTFVMKKNNKRIYPASIRMKVALDNGRILAFDATDYLVNKQENYNVDDPKLTKKEALKTINGHVKVRETHMAVIQNEMGDYILCYEFLATKSNNRDTYRVLINANNGQEEKVQLLTK